MGISIQPSTQHVAVSIAGVYRDSNSDPSIVQPVASRYTDCAIPAHIITNKKKAMHFTHLLRCDVVYIRKEQNSFQKFSFAGTSDFLNCVLSYFVIAQLQSSFLSKFIYPYTGGTL
jgi:hypothetical protein